MSSQTGLPLMFPQPLVIVGGGSVAPDTLMRLRAAGFGLAGADMGGDTILAAGLVPDALIGDFDSVTDLARFPASTRRIWITEQDTTDFEKALMSTEAPLTLALGMTGGRLDHTLAALHALTRFGAERRIVLVDEQDIALALTGPIALDVPEGTRVSIYPLAAIGFAGSDGLRYPLDGLVMAQGEAIGTSNTATASRIAIRPAPMEKAPWLLVLPGGLLGDLIVQLTGVSLPD